MLYKERRKNAVRKKCKRRKEMGDDKNLRKTEDDKNLRLARQARAEGNSEDAKLYYGKVRENDPENAEAKYFYAYYSLYEGTNGELPKRFSRLCESLGATIDLIKNSGEEKEDSLKTVEEIVASFVPEPWAQNKYMNKKNHEERVGDKYVTVFSSGDIGRCCSVGMAALKVLGDKVSALYPDDAECQRIASIAWKEYVSLSQTWYAYAVQGDAEAYAEKIKKVDPSYTMPKKAGCINVSGKRQ